MSFPAEDLPTDEVELEEDPSGLVGEVLADRFRVKSLLGVGGIGRVYRAEHMGLGRHVALKVLLEHYACVPELQRRFEREAMALAALRHPNIVVITDFVATRRVTFLVMELVEGEDLDQLIEDGLAPEDAIDVITQILGSLAYAHRRGVIHRDLKPQNVLVAELPGGRLHAVVLDFGLAKFMDPGSSHATLTKTGLVVGTPAYMAPEQASGGRVDARSDVYAVGVLMYELLTGVLPFDGDQSDVLRQHLLKAPPTLADACPEATIAPELEALIARTLAKTPGDRHQDAGDLLACFLALPPDPFVREGGPERRAARALATGAHTHVAVPREKPAIPVWAAAVISAAVSAVVVALLFLLLGGDGDDEETTSSGSDMVITVQDVLDEESALAREAAEEEGEIPDDVTEPPEEAADPTLDEEADAPLEEDDDVGDVPPPATRPAARNPWRGRIPSTLARVRRRVTRGHPITKRHVRQVARYRQSHPSDVRAVLVLAHAYMARGWFSNALTQYRRAYRRDPTSRGDARMRRDMVRMAGRESLHTRATEALSEIYGDEAISLVQRAVERERDDETRARLEATLGALSSAD